MPERTVSEVREAVCEAKVDAEAAAEAGCEEEDTTAASDFDEVAVRMHRPVRSQWQNKGRGRWLLTVFSSI